MIAKARTKRKSKAGHEIIAALTEAVDALESGGPLSKRFTIRDVRMSEPLKARELKSVRATRDQLNVSQAVFAQFLGVNLNTVQSWEQGQRKPSGIARRFLDEINRDPAYWRDRITAAAT